MKTNIAYDVPTYPEFGHIYPGDYYADLPFDRYIDRQQPLPRGANVFDIRDFGAVPEKERLNTQAFWAAAKACEEAGGGTILVAGGSYWIGAVSIPSNTTLFIAADSEIVASRNVREMSALAAGIQGNEHGSAAFVLISNADNVTVTGGGRICGNGEWYVYEPRELPSLTPFPVTHIPRRDQADQINTLPGTIRYFYRQRIRYAEDKYGEGKAFLERPGFMVLVRGSSRVKFENIILHDAMAWTFNIEDCRDVTVRNVVVDDNRHVANTDGMDICNSTNVLVEHCFVSCADDGICIKSLGHCPRPAQNITVRDCTVVSVMNAFKVGTETGHDVRNVLVENCHFCMPDIYPGSVCGITLVSCDGTNLQNVTLRHITMDKVVCPLYICLNMRNRYKDPYSDTVGANRYWGGSISNITIEDVQATDVELPSIVTGFVAQRHDGQPVRQPVRNLQIKNFRVVYRDNEEQVAIPQEFDEFLTDYPESNAHGDVDACGLWVRHADGVLLQDIQVTPRSCNTREAVRLYDVR